MSHQAEIEAESFFKRGDDGTYEGGPADLVFAGMSDPTQEDAPAPRTAEQIRRRNHFKHWVTGIVATLAAGSALAFAVRFGKSATGSTATSPGTTPRPYEALAAPDDFPRAIQKNQDLEPSKPFSPVASSVPEPIVPKPGPTPAIAPPHDISTKASAKPRATVQPGRTSVRLPAPSELTPATAPPANVSVHAAPPTATFAD